MLKHTALLFIVAFASLPGCKAKQKPKVTSVKIEPVPLKPSERAASKGPKGIPAHVDEQIKDRNRDSLLGGELGLDHVGVAVSDLDAAKRAYIKLGFGRPQHGMLPNGLKNVNFYFGDTTYLELVTAYDKKKSPWIADFIDRYEKGPMFLVLSVFSIPETTAFLKSRGIVMQKPFEGRIEVEGFKKTQGPMWHTLFFNKSPLPGDNVYFIAYQRNARNYLLKSVKDARVRRKVFGHPNTALGVKSVWMAVKSVEACKKSYVSIGLPAGDAVHLPKLGARGVAVKAGHGDILLLSSNDRKTPVSKFIARRNEGMIGMSIEVANLKKAQILIRRTGHDPIPYDGRHGRSLLVPPQVTADVWLEFFQKPDPAS